MSTLLEPVLDIATAVAPVDSEFRTSLFKNNRQIKSKENIYKHHRKLKNKLKKYKLRKDGHEDPEVIDVSQILVTSLKIKSPNNKIGTNGINYTEDELKPKNYLFKMGRKKQTNKKKVTAEANVLHYVGNLKENLSSVVCTDESVSNSTNKNTLKIVEKKLHSNENNDEAKKKSNDKKQTNAFTLMMDSRNKSIGGNSPGKEKVVDDLDLEATIEKKTIKAKRNLLLQKMAEAKGSLKKKEVEEYQEECIKKKMDKRAERLRNMIRSKDTKSADKDDVKTTSKKESTLVITKGNEDLSLRSNKNKLKLVNVFDDPAETRNIPYRKREIVTKEDDEFLKKLSPSLKKKENMLCYFKKVEKEEVDFVDSSDDNAPVIKVKLKIKGKNKSKKKKLSLSKDHENQDKNNMTNKEIEIKRKKLSLNKNIVNQDENHISNNEIEVTEAPKNKKRNKILETDQEVFFSKTDDSTKTTEIDIMRPRRNVKRPAKYIDDMQLSSSDEELHIFTPKKKKHVDQQNTCDFENKVILGEAKPNKSIEKRELKAPALQKVNTKSNEGVQLKNYTKLAPIFAAKPLLDAAAIEAKQKFLNSGVPDKLKKMIEKQTSKTVGLNHFHTVVHVQQLLMSSVLAKLEIIFNQLSQSDEEEEEIVYEQDFFRELLKKDTRIEEINLPLSGEKIQMILQNMKKLYPKFPVYRTYRLLRDKNRGEFKDCSYLDLDNSIEVINGMIDVNNGSPDRLSWTDKYKAMSSKQIIGNFESIKELKKWLILWTENENKLKKNNANSDSSDFYLSDTDSKDSMKSTNNLLVLTGPTGSGKTSLVYAVAAELAIKVLEVNASNKRTGKIMLQDLQEATQSHKVNRGKSSQELSQKSQEFPRTEKLKVCKKRGRPKKDMEVKSKKTEPIPKQELLSQPTCSQDSARTGMSLILIDDADIVFDQDDGFCAAIVQLVQCSKRPVILITSSTSCPHLQRFIQCAKIIHTRPLFPRMLGTWLDIMCLADSGTCWPGLGAKSLDYFKGDIRKTINFLQFRTAKNSAAEDESSSQNIDYRISMEDENSNMSWSDREPEKNENNKTNITIDSKIWQYFMQEEACLLFFKHPINIFRIWWNIPRVLISPLDSNIKAEEAAGKKDIDILANVTDMVSAVDYFCPSSGDKESELISYPWANFESHSVSEHECLDKYDRHWETVSEISHSLLSGSIEQAQRDLELKSSTDLHFPEMSTRRERDRIADRHNKLSSFLSPSAVLDRRGLALDYWSGCRAICRVEQTKTDSNSKRNNRFCHYLKSANILCKSDSFDNLANSLYCKE